MIWDFISFATNTKDFGIKSINILTNNPKKIESLEKYSVDVKKRIDSETEPTTENKKYLETKRDKMHDYILKNNWIESFF